MSQRIPNKQPLIFPKFNMDANACSAVALNEAGDTNQKAPLTIPYKLGNEDTYTTHTDYISASGTASASSHFDDANWKPWYPLDGTPIGSGGWVTSSGLNTGWWQYEFTEPKVVESISIGSADGYPVAFPTDIIFQVSDDGVNFTDILTVSGQTILDDGSKNTYTMPAGHSGKFFRMSVAGSHTFVGFGRGMIMPYRNVQNHNIPYEVDGVEKVDNGTFDVDVNGWEAWGGTPILTWSAGTLRMENGDSPSSRVFTTITCEIGKTYLVTRDYIHGDRWNVGENNAPIATTDDFIIFEATATTMYVVFYAVLGLGDYVQIDNVSVKEVTLGSAHLTVRDKATKKHGTLGNTGTGGSNEDFEKIINGDFTTGDLTGFGNTSAFEPTFETAGFVTTKASDSWLGIYSQDFVTEVGKTYFLGGDFLKVDSPYAKAVVQTSTHSTLAAQDLPADGRIGLTFVAITTLTKVLLTSYYSETTSKFGNISVREVMPVSTTFDQIKSFSNGFCTDIPLTEADYILLDDDPSLLAQLWFGSLTTGLSFATSNIKNLYLGNTGKASGHAIQDLAQPTNMTSLPVNISRLPFARAGVTFTDDGTNIIVTNDAGSAGARQIIYWYISKFYNPQLVPSTFGASGYGIMNIKLASLPTNNKLLLKGSIPVYADTGFFNSVTQTWSEGGLSDIELKVGDNFIPHINPEYAYNYLELYFEDGSIADEFKIEEITWETFTKINLENYTANCKGLFVNENEGLSKFKLLEDESSRAIGVTKPNEIAYANDDGRNAPMNFFPNRQRQMFREIVSGELQEFGVDTLLNGEFSTTIDNWIAYIGGSVVWDNDANGSALFTITAINEGIRQNNTVQQGKNLVTFSMKSSALRTWDYFNGATWQDIPKQPTKINEYETFSFILEATGLTNLILREKDGVNGDTFYFDYIKCEPLTTKTEPERLRDAILSHDERALTRPELAYQTWTLYGSNTLVDNGDGSYTITVVDNDLGAYMRSFISSVDERYLVQVTNLKYSEPVTDEQYQVWAGTYTGATVPLGTERFEFISGAGANNFYFKNLKVGSTITAKISFKRLTVEDKYFKNGILQAEKKLGAELLDLNDWVVIGEDATNTGTVDADSLYINQVNTDSIVIVKNDAALEIGKVYQLDFEEENLIGVGLKFDMDGSTVPLTGGGPIIFYADRTTLAFYREGVPTETILTNLSLKEVTARGPEGVDNGTFDTDTDWIKDTNWTISSGKAISDGSNIGVWGFLTSPIQMMQANKTYEITYEVTDYTSGSVFIGVAGVNGIERFSIGTFIEILTPTADSAIQVISHMTNNFIGSVDNVSVKEVLVDAETYIDSDYIKTSPVLPDPSIMFNQKDIALIGYPDKINRRHNEFLASTRIPTEGEVLANHNAWLLENKDVFTATPGGTDYLTDENGVYLYA